ncbi:hypothetical protein FJZ36_04445 [Candidatus Poribacteria bacterium]|nr:hypothetical protein [Candidatus Poribacteria bacterium]
MSSRPLSGDQVTHYREHGWVLVSGLIGDDIVASAAKTLWRLMNASADDPSGWVPTPSPSSHSRDPALLAIYTPEFLGAAAQLGGGDPATYRAPGSMFPLNSWPTKEPWRHHGPHIDHAIREHGHRTFPLPVRVATMTYLNDVSPHGGGTVVWSGSHTKIAALAESDRTRYEMMWRLNQDLHLAEIGEPTELTPRLGDVLFYHILSAHSGSLNATETPRLAFNTKW